MFSLESLLAEVDTMLKLIIELCWMSDSKLDVFTFFYFPPLLL